MDSKLPLFKASKYLIYTCFESKMPENMGGSIIGGSLLHERFSNTEEEAKAHIVELQALKDKCTLFNSDSTRKSRFTYILNESHWWP